MKRKKSEKKCKNTVYISQMESKQVCQKINKTKGHVCTDTNQTAHICT